MSESVLPQFPPTGQQTIPVTFMVSPKEFEELSMVARRLHASVGMFLRGAIGHSYREHFDDQFWINTEPIVWQRVAASEPSRTALVTMVESMGIPSGGSNDSLRRFRKKSKR